MPDEHVDFDLGFEAAAMAAAGPPGNAGDAAPRLDMAFPSDAVLPLQAVDGPAAPDGDAKVVGRMRSLLGSDALRLRLVAANRAAQAAGKRLRVRLELEGVPELEPLPWEALIDNSSVDSSNTAPALTVLRHVAMEGTESLIPAAPLRVLAVLASPPDLAPFDAEREWWDLLRVLRPLVDCGLLSVDLLPEASVAAMINLSPKGHHVVHFVGAGRSNPRAGYASLMLTGSDRRTRAVTADYLGPLLAHDLVAKLILLNIGGRCSEVHPFSASARTFIRCGVPAVVAMRRRLSAEAADFFFARLYSLLAEGAAVDVCVAEARRSLQGAAMEPDRAAPVLYARSGESLRFMPSGKVAPSLRLRTPPQLAARPQPPAPPQLRAQPQLQASPQPRPQHLDFALKIESGRDGEYPVFVLASPAGATAGSLLQPFPDPSLLALLERLPMAVRATAKAGARDLERASGAGVVAAADPREAGSRLFEALFSGPVLRLFDRSLAPLEDPAAAAAGLRLSLHLGTDHADLSLMASLPWELLYSRERREFLCLSRKCPLVRALDVPRPLLPLRIERPLRILVAAASPAELASLDLVEERRRIEASWMLLRGVEVEFLDHVSPLDLRSRLHQKPFHVLHFMGHAGFDPREGTGALAFEDGAGRAAPLTGSALANLVRDFSSLQLVLLNACDTARSPHRNGVDPFADVASTLVIAGLPAVVAMQFPISDGAAIAFATAFYDRLAAGESIDSAVVEGRVAITLSDPGSLEWATPVLFLRGGGGSLLGAAPPARGGAVGARRKAPQSEAKAGPRSKHVQEDAERVLREKRERGEFDVFLCYQPADKSAVREIYRQLERRAILSWLDEREIRPGESWQRLLEQQIGCIRSAAVFVGAEGIGPWQRRELDAVLRELVHRSCPVIPVLLAGAPMRPDLPIFLREFLWVDFCVTSPDPIEQLMWGITGKHSAVAGG